MSAATELAALKAAWGRVRNEVNRYDLLVRAPAPTPAPAKASITAKAGRPKVEIQALLYVASSGTTPNIALSASHAPVGSSITITGMGFGALKGASTVTFGERPNSKGWASCAVVASVTNWSNTSITCTVPSMSPGKAGAPSTYHPVYVTVNGVLTDSANFYIDPVTTYTGQSYKSYDASARHDVLFDSCSFSSNTSVYTDNAMRFSGGGYNVTFYNCTFSSTGSNGATINELSNSGIRDITFANCHWNYCHRISFECTARYASTTSYKRIALIDAVFEVSGSEALSFDGYDEPWGATYCLVKNVLIKGAGNSYDDPQWEWGSHGFEINGGTYFTMQNLRVNQTRAYAINMNGSDYTYRVFEDCIFDRSTRDPAATFPVATYVRNLLCPTGSRQYYLRCTFHSGTDVSHSNGQFGEGAPYNTPSSYNVMEDCTFLGDAPGFSNYDGSVGNTGMTLYT